MSGRPRKIGPRRERGHVSVTAETYALLTAEAKRRNVTIASLVELACAHELLSAVAKEPA